ncbi:Asp-domain-containing protein [Eremomyces bilateralis CBS 781.70]|uniref:Probable aspartic-type endopeptidase OPSB n=1 Tax=Eremomyces bilateralis CBS 781.70 TaxID=1392243 RepID=A0A6G1FW15_9PEZI|nr:Asp-domain-containing protein [Eremomyces bilateralis CBS 781.70]KAF1809918.1 Asp-domain-containing protein [Eremomyces bilateralis CBS 781.70]
MPQIPLYIVTLDNQETLYLANLTIGTPGQQIQLHIDTGSSDLWVNAVPSEFCESNGRCRTGAYDANASSTYHYVNSQFDISYQDGTGASGDYVKDNVDIGGAILDGQQFGVGYESSNGNGVLGIGYPINEVAVGRAGLKPYPNVPQKLQEQGLVQSNAYSLWLNDMDANTGSILFGGVDTEKYEGELYTLPILSQSGVYVEFAIGLTEMASGGKTIFKDEVVPVLLDSGSSLIYLPNKIVDEIYDRYSVTYDTQEGYGFVECDLANSDDTIDFTFTKPTISVPMNELIFSSSSDPGSNDCVFGIAPSEGSSSVVLGDTFLRSAYVVYDLTNNEISIAATNFNSTESKIQAITNDSDGVPNAVHVDGAPSTAAVAPGTGRTASIQSDVSEASAAKATPPPTLRKEVLAGAAAMGAGLFMAS